MSIHCVYLKTSPGPTPNVTRHKRTATSRPQESLRVQMRWVSLWAGQFLLGSTWGNLLCCIHPMQDGLRDHLAIAVYPTPNAKLAHFPKKSLAQIDRVLNFIVFLFCHINTEMPNQLKTYLTELPKSANSVPSTCLKYHGGSQVDSPGRMTTSTQIRTSNCRPPAHQGTPRAG